MSTTENRAEPTASKRIATQASSLNELVGGHPETLESIFRAGKVADPAELGDAPRGRHLAFVPGTQAYMLMRSLSVALSGDWMPWKGVEFDHGGNSGTNIVLAKRVLRFRTEVTASDVDGQPTLALVYGDAAFKNPWPLSGLRDELRGIGDGLALGLGLLAWRGRRVPLFWFGLERAGG